MGAKVVGHRRVDHDGVDVDHRDDRVEVHRGAFLGDRHGKHDLGEAALQRLAGEALEAGRSRTFADSDGEDARRQQQDVAALEVLEVRAVRAWGVGEARMVLVDESRQLGLAYAGRHREAGDRHTTRQPHRRVAGEQQVGQRVDQEALGRQQAGDDAAEALDLVVAQAGCQRHGQLGGRLVGHHPGDVVAQSVAEAQARGGRLDDAGAYVGVDEGLGEQVHEVEDLDVMVAQRLGERVVLLLRAANPRDTVEQQRVVVAWCQTSELGTRSVQHDRPQPPDFTVCTQCHSNTLVKRVGADDFRTAQVGPFCCARTHLRLASVVAL